MQLRKLSFLQNMDDTVDDKPGTNSLEPTILQQSKEILRESKPSEDISINSNPKVIVEEKPEIVTPKGPKNTLTVFEKLDIHDQSNSSSDSAVTDEAEKDAKSPDSKPQSSASASEIKERPSDRNKSDIFSLDDKIKAADTIFSINGTPSGKINRRREEYSEVFPVGCMGCKDSKEEHPSNTSQKSASSKTLISSSRESQSRPVSGRFSRHRNPLTGAGVDSTDEMKRGSTGRRRGYIHRVYTRGNTQSSFLKSFQMEIQYWV